MQNSSLLDTLLDMHHDCRLNLLKAREEIDRLEKQIVSYRNEIVSLKNEIELIKMTSKPRGAGGH